MVSDSDLKRQIKRFKSVENEWQSSWEKATFSGDYSNMSPSTKIYKDINLSSNFLLRNVNCFVKNYKSNLNEKIDLWGGGYGFIQSVERATGILEDVNFNTKD